MRPLSRLEKSPLRYSAFGIVIGFVMPPNPGTTPITMKNACALPIGKPERSILHKWTADGDTVLILANIRDVPRRRGYVPRYSH